jgi:integrase-like protein
MQRSSTCRRRPDGNSEYRHDGASDAQPAILGDGGGGTYSDTDSTESSHHRTGQTSFFATLECELLDRHDWPTRQALRTTMFDFIEVFCNRQRRDSTLDCASPATYERQHTPPAPAA